MLSLYDVTIPTYLQFLAQVTRLIGKAEAWCADQGLPPGKLIEARLAPDMMPFSYQVKSTAIHSLAAIEGARAGQFSPDFSTPPDSFDGLRERMTATIAALEAIDPAEINALVGRDMAFVAGDARMEYLAENFLLSFSMPNFFFHVTTAYDILRANGLPLGKRDYIGRPRVKV